MKKSLIESLNGIKKAGDIMAVANSLRSGVSRSQSNTKLKDLERYIKDFYRNSVFCSS